MKKHIKKLINEGYIDNDGMPLKCKCCDSDNLKTYTTSTQDGYTVERNCECIDCGVTVSNWAYGNWQT